MSDINEFQIHPDRGRHRRYQSTEVPKDTHVPVKTVRVNRRSHKRRQNAQHGRQRNPQLDEVETTVVYEDITDGAELHIAKGCKYVKELRNGKYVYRKVCYCPKNPGKQIYCPKLVL